MTKDKWLVISISVLSIYLVWILTSAMQYKPVVEENTTFAAEGFYAPDFTLETLEGESFTLSEHIGKPIVITLWASWCVPCRNEMPALNEIFNEYQGDVVIVGVNATSQDKIADVRSFVAENELAFPIVLDESGEVSRLYQLQGLPTLFIIDRNGIIRRKIMGQTTATSIRISIESILEDDNVPSY